MGERISLFNGKWAMAIGAVVLAGVALAPLRSPAPRLAQSAPGKYFDYVPDTISAEGQDLLRRIGRPSSPPGSLPEPDDLEAWRLLQTAVEGARRGDAVRALETCECSVSELKLGGAPVLDIRPDGAREAGSAIVYIHGGGWVFFSARSSLAGAARVARTTGHRVVSVDYTLAPFAKWPLITDQVISAVKGLVADGVPMREIALFGDSAGGNLAVAVTLKMRDLGLGMPGAVVTWSVSSDFADTADTRTTLRDADPALHYEKQVKNSMRAYADERDWKNPYVSPVYGDFKKGFPPALIQAGTREILLSDSVRLYQAIEAAGGDAKLDIYEGMPHDFQAQIPDSPEAKLALVKMKAFLNRHLSN